MKFLVLALFHGDHPALARRCGDTLRRLWNTGQVDLRVGLNAVAPASHQLLVQLLPGVPMVSADPQVYKYPMMRRLLEAYRGDATHLMWFDDDSCLLPGVSAGPWLRAVAQRAAGGAAALGSLYRQALSPEQRHWITQQAWYTGREVPHEVDFATGGWQVVPLDLLRRLDFPSRELLHNGGDILLGAMLHQQGLVAEQFRSGLAINADEGLRECTAPRRGFCEPVEALWSDLKRTA
jgi:hypothetical protein